MATRRQTACVRLRIFDAWPLDHPGFPDPDKSGGGGAVRGDLAPASDREAGCPSVIGRANGYPLEARVWRSRPPAIADAIWHPAGIWLAVRVLDHSTA